MRLIYALIHRQFNWIVSKKHCSPPEFDLFAKVFNRYIYIYIYISDEKLRDRGLSEKGLSKVINKKRH